jgi:nicotinamide riboside transporter PnuC
MTTLIWILVNIVSIKLHQFKEYESVDSYFFYNQHEIRRLLLSALTTLYQVIQLNNADRETNGPCRYFIQNSLIRTKINVSATT